MSQRGVGCYSGRVVGPFRKVFAERASDLPPVIDQLGEVDPDGRLPISAALTNLASWVEQTENPDLGLLAARNVSPGSFGVLDYAMHTAPTLRAAVELGARYARLYSDTLAPRLEQRGRRVFLKLHERFDWPRAAGDFTVAAWYGNHLRGQYGEQLPLEVWCAHARPADLRGYEATFVNASFRFDTAWYGFMMTDQALEARQLARHDGLHALFRAQSDLLARSLAPAQGMTAQLRSWLLVHLPQGGLTAAAIASALHISERTLFRRLHSEGTSFAHELDQLREQLAREYVAQSTLAISEISLLLAFSHPAAFHRAFKRWTGVTPSQYRRIRATG
jgi:AraC-like DNA-binding protein